MDWIFHTPFQYTADFLYHQWPPLVVEPTVTADHEHTIESKEFFNTLKGPEHAAANAVSMSSSQDGAQTSASSLNFLVIYLSLFGGCQNEQYLMVMRVFILRDILDMIFFIYSFNRVQS